VCNININIIIIENINENINNINSNDNINNVNIND